MLIIPAIDLKDGRCVRLRQGDMREETVYSDDPAAMARHWEALGAGLLHIVDLNGALEGRPRNMTLIESILKVISIPVQIGGGVRTMETIGWYAARGVQRIVLGTAAFQDRGLLERACAQFPGRILVGIDAWDGRVAMQGWTSISEISACDFVRRLAGYSLAGVIYTDISKDGMLSGPNLTAIRDMAERSPVPVIASGGIAGISDILAIKALGPRIEGAIVGKALYDGRLDLRQALEAVA
jgi:phosphoribosylformimino-5-aminoimidazole carboxamide ribotide isomerase